jgi:hypothetical protein
MHTGAEVDSGAWTSLCGSGTGNSLAGTTSHESRPPCLLAGASIVDAHSLGGATAAMRHGGGGGRGRLSLVGMRRGGGRIGWGATLRGTGGGEAEWGGRMGTVMQGENGAASIRTHGSDEWIGSLGERRMWE